jgi:hypothetical protein
MAPLTLPTRRDGKAGDFSLFLDLSRRAVHQGPGTCTEVGDRPLEGADVVVVIILDDPGGFVGVGVV